MNNLSNIKNFLFKSRLHTFITIIITVAIIFFVWRIFGNKTSTPQYQTAAVEKGTLVVSVSASGNITSGGNVDITTSATGTVNNVYVKNGDKVIAGQKIADLTLDQNSQQKQAAAFASYLSSQNSLNSAQAKLNSLQSTLFKTNQAFVTDRGILNPSDDQKADPKYIEENADWLQAEADYKNQQGVIAQAASNLTSNWISYQQLSSIITAASVGTISNLNLTSGLPIVPQTSSSNSNNNTPQVVGGIMLDNASLQATVNVSEVDAPKIKVGQKATLTLDAFANKTFTGKVSAINTNGAISSGVISYPTTITMDTIENNIYPNMNVAAKIITEIKDNVLLVPTAALQTSNGQTTIRVMSNGQVQSVDVITGDSNDTQTEITSGVKENDNVVVGVLTQTTTTSATSSPFGGGTGFGALRGFGGGGGGGGGGNTRSGSRTGQ